MRPSRGDVVPAGCRAHTTDSDIYSVTLQNLHGATSRGQTKNIFAFQRHVTYHACILCPQDTQIALESGGLFLCKLQHYTTFPSIPYMTLCRVTISCDLESTLVNNLLFFFYFFFFTRSHEELMTLRSI